jgi:hypothetical protein
LQVAQANLSEEDQPFSNFGQDVARDHRGAAMEFKPAEQFIAGFDWHLGKGVNRRRRGQIEIPQIRVFEAQLDGSRQRIEPRPSALRAKLTLAFLPSVPRLLDRVGPGAPVNFGQVEQFAKPAASRAPSLRGVVAEVFRI